MKQYYVYILVSKSRVLYVGLTNDLERRLFDHRQKIIEGFTSKYNVNRLAYYEYFENIRDAIAREKQIKGWRREKKLALIESMNPQWRDLSAEWQNGRDSSTSPESHECFGASSEWQFGPVAW
ncbi:MAG: GIY-YIG nuclease family protein [Verrucomicrobiia bacterium]|jgi:putative endonuclease